MNDDYVMPSDKSVSTDELWWHYFYVQGMTDAVSDTYGTYAPRTTYTPFMWEAYIHPKRRTPIGS